MTDLSRRHTSPVAESSTTRRHPLERRRGCPPAGTDGKQRTQHGRPIRAGMSAGMGCASRDCVGRVSREYEPRRAADSVLYQVGSLRDVLRAGGLAADGEGLPRLIEEEFHGWSLL